MMDEDKECKAVVSQLSAARSALERAIAVIVAENLQHMHATTARSRG